MIPMKSTTAQILADLIKRLPLLETCNEQIQAAFDILFKCADEGRTILVCGNGGSASDAEHIVGELMKGFLLARPIPADDMERFEKKSGEEAHVLISKLQQAIPAISLVSQTSLCTAVANDNGGDMIFAQQVYGYGEPGNVLIAISTSGNAKNVFMAVHTARALGMPTIGLSGREGGNLRPLCDVCICVPAEGSFKVQELHQPVYHALCAMLESELFGE